MICWPFGSGMGCPGSPWTTWGHGRYCQRCEDEEARDGPGEELEKSDYCEEYAGDISQ